MTLDEAEKLGLKMIESVQRYVAKAVDSLAPRFASTEARIADLEARIAAIERAQGKSSARGKR